MKNKVHETIIIGAGISGLACARKLHENGKEFLVISEDIGGKIQTSKDGEINYGCYLITDNDYHMKKFVKIKRKMPFSSILFHKGSESYKIIGALRHPLHLLKWIFYGFKFKRHYELFRKRCETMSQAEAFRLDPFLFGIYCLNTQDFIEEHDVVWVSKKYEGLSCAFSGGSIPDVSTFLFLKAASLIMTDMYEAKFQIEEMIKEFKNNILIDSVKEIEKKKDFYVIRTKKRNYYAKNVVVATPPNVSRKLLYLKKIKKPVSYYVFHISGRIREPWKKSTYHFFSENNITAIIHQTDGSFLLYSLSKNLDFKKYFYDYKIIYEKFWNPAINLSGNVLWECEQDKNLYLIGEHNGFGVEDVYITGLYAANQIIKVG